MQARADAVQELTDAGTLDDFTSSHDDIDRQLSQIQQSGQVDDELAKLKAELGPGDQAKELPAADPADAAEPAGRRGAGGRKPESSGLDLRVRSPSGCGMRAPTRAVAVARGLPAAGVGGRLGRAARVARKSCGDGCKRSLGVAGRPAWCRLLDARCRAAAVCDLATAGRPGRKRRGPFDRLRRRRADRAGGGRPALAAARGGRPARPARPGSGRRFRLRRGTGSPTGAAG